MIVLKYLKRKFYFYGWPLSKFFYKVLVILAQESFGVKRSEFVKACDHIYCDLLDLRPKTTGGGFEGVVQFFVLAHNLYGKSTI